MARCIAYLESGRICGQPAAYVDAQRGGYVCAAHRREAVARHGPEPARTTRDAERPLEADGALVADLGQLKALARLQADGARNRGDILAAGILMALAGAIEGELRPRRAALEARQAALEARKATERKAVTA